MNLKYKILNEIDNKLKKYRTPEYDKILSCDVKGEVKGAFMTTDCTTVEELTNKYQKGLIDIDKLLFDELDDVKQYHIKEIVLCEKDNIACIYNSKHDRYYEDVHECFENAEERVYVKFDSDNAYKTFKNFVLQSSKYHGFVKFENEIPRKKAFEKIFLTEEKKVETDSKENEVKKIENYVQITGKISSIGKQITKKDGDKAQLIDIQQEYEYNGKIKYNKISIMLSSELLNEIVNMGENDTISIVGKLNNYTDQNNNLKAVVICDEVNILDNSKDLYKQEELER